MFLTKPTTIYSHDLSIHIVAGAACQINNRTFEIIWVSPPLCWNACHDISAAYRIIHKCVRQICLDVACKILTLFNLMISKVKIPCPFWSYQVQWRLRSPHVAPIRSRALL